MLTSCGKAGCAVHGSIAGTEVPCTAAAIEVLAEVVAYRSWYTDKQLQGR